MILLTYRTPQGLKLGIKTPQGVLDVAAARAALGPSHLPVTPEQVIAAGQAVVADLALLAERSASRPDLFRAESDLQIGPCVPNPGKIICIGLNYRKHVAESGAPVPDVPVLFSKFSNAVCAPGDPIPLPTNAVEYDYEVELVVVIGRQAKYVSREQALDYVFGYCCTNDMSARDLQFRTNQWLLGKTQDNSMPLGPYLVTSDEVGDPQALGLRCWVNGELRQNSSTSDMIFTVAEMVSYISQYMTLEPGDLISTGTPEGVVYGMKEKRWLNPGDVVTCEIDKLGRLTNPMVREEAPEWAGQRI